MIRAHSLYKHRRFHISDRDLMKGGSGFPRSQCQSSFLAVQEYHTRHSCSGVALDVNFAAKRTQGDSYVLVVPPLVRKNVSLERSSVRQLGPSATSHSLSRLRRNVPAEAKCLHYTSNLKWGLFYAGFRSLAWYYG